MSKKYNWSSSTINKKRKIVNDDDDDEDDNEEEQKLPNIIQSSNYNSSVFTLEINYINLP